MAQKAKKQRMLKCKNEATILLKTKGNAWVRLSKRSPNEPILGANEPKLGTRDLGFGKRPTALAADMDDGFDHTVAARGDHLERRLSFFEGEVMGHEGIEADHALRHHFDGGGDAPVLPADVFDAHFLAAQQVNVETYPVVLRNTHDEQRAARLEQLDSLIEGFLRARAFEDEIQSQRFEFGDS